MYLVPCVSTRKQFGRKCNDNRGCIYLPYCLGLVELVTRPGLRREGWGKNKTCFGAEETMQQAETSLISVFRLDGNYKHCTGDLIWESADCPESAWRCELRPRCPGSLARRFTQLRHAATWRHGHAAAGAVMRRTHGKLILRLSFAVSRCCHINYKTQVFSTGKITNNCYCGNNL